MQKRDKGRDRGHKGRDKDKMDHLDPLSKDLIRQYRAISAKMKKRFLKKPNFPEASKEFGRLGSMVKYAENHDFAALCYSAMAKCDGLIGDCGAEAESWAMAGREFLEAEDILYSGRHVTYWDSLEAAIHCFLLAIRVHEKQGNNIMAAMFCQEIGGKCMYFQKYGESARFLQQASDLQKDLPENRLQTLAKVAKCKVYQRDYEGALTVYSKMTAEARAIIKDRDLRRGPFVRFSGQYEIAQLLLLLMLKYPRKSLKRENLELIERYSKDLTDSATFTGHVDPDRYILLQSLIMACEAKNFEEIEAIRPRIWDLLDGEQQHLFCLLMETHSTKLLPTF